MSSAPVEPPEDGPSDGPILPRWMRWVAIPAGLLPLLIFAFILFTEGQHRSPQCRYREVSTRQLAADVVVREDARSCVQDVEERRYSLVRAGKERILGRRRFAPDRFQAEHYRWEATISEAQEVVLTVHNEGHDDILFREGTPEELEKGISY